MEPGTGGPHGPPGAENHHVSPPARRKTPNGVVLNTRAHTLTWTGSESGNRPRENLQEIRPRPRHQPARLMNHPNPETFQVGPTHWRTSPSEFHSWESRPHHRRSGPFLGPFRGLGPEETNRLTTRAAEDGGHPRDSGISPTLTGVLIPPNPPRPTNGCDARILL